jgi:HD-like signal output (HDOD) protein
MTASAPKKSAKDLQKWLETHRLLPSFPSVLGRLDSLLTDPTVTIEQVADLLSTDIGVSARLMKTVNTGRYVMHAPAASITEAISRLGLKEVRLLAYAASFMSLMSAPNHFSPRQFWRSAFVSAVSARELTLLLQSKEIEITFDAAAAFLLGLCHDMGIFVLDACCPEEFQLVTRQARENPSALARHEQQEMGLNHGVAGAVMLQMWHFPDDWVIAVAGHSFPARLPKDKQVLSDVLLIAESMAFYLGYNNGVCAGTPNVLHELTLQRLQQIGLSSGEFELLSVRVRALIDSEGWLGLADEMPH